MNSEQFLSAERVFLQWTDFLETFGRHKEATGTTWRIQCCNRTETVNRNKGYKLDPVRCPYYYVQYVCVHFGEPTKKPMKRYQTKSLPCNCKATFTINYVERIKCYKIKKFFGVHTGHGPDFSRGPSFPISYYPKKEEQETMGAEPVLQTPTSEMLLAQMREQYNKQVAMDMYSIQQQVRKKHNDMEQFVGTINGVMDWSTENAPVAVRWREEPLPTQQMNAGSAFRDRNCEDESIDDLSVKDKYRLALAVGMKLACQLATLETSQFLVYDRLLEQFHELVKQGAPFSLQFEGSAGVELDVSDFSYYDQMAAKCHFQEAGGHRFNRPSEDVVDMSPDMPLDLSMKASAQVRLRMQQSSSSRSASTPMSDEPLDLSYRSAAVSATLPLANDSGLDLSTNKAVKQQRRTLQSLIGGGRPSETNSRRDYWLSDYASSEYSATSVFRWHNTQ